MSTPLPVLDRGLLSTIAATPRSVSTVLVDDSISQPTATELQFGNHDPEIGVPFAGESIVKHPSSQSSMFIASNTVYNSSGSLRAIYYYNIDPGTVDVTVYGEFVITSNVQGNSSAVCARMDPSANSFYYLALQPLTIGPALQLKLGKFTNGTETNLQTVSYATGTIPGAAVLVKIWFNCSNDEKVGFIQGPDDDEPIRLVHSGDNAIPGGGGFAGVTMLRSAHTQGQHLTHFTLTSNGPQAPSGVTVAPSPDPVQAPQLLWTPDYSAATLTVSNGNTGIWYREQEYYNRGVRQTDGAQVVTGASIPGSGAYKPSTGALEVQIGPWNPTSVTVAVTAPALSSDLVLTMSAPDVAKLFDKDALFCSTGEKLRVNGTPSGTSVPVIRAQRSTAVPIATSDVITVITGDVNDSGSSTNADFTSRIEVYDRFAKNADGSSNGSAPAASWPDPVGSIRWYGVSIYCDPSNYPTSGANNPWGPIHIQWKGQFGGSPPRALEHEDGHFFLAGTRTRRDLGVIPSGVWNRYVFGIRWETSDVNGWTEVWVNGALKAAKAYQSTMDKHSGGADPIYLKDGIYRSAAWANATHRVWLSPIKVGTTIDDVFNP